MNALTPTEQHHLIGIRTTPRRGGGQVSTLPEHRSLRSESSPAGHVQRDA